MFKENFNTEVNCFLKRNFSKERFYIKAEHHKFRIKTSFSNGKESLIIHSLVAKSSSIVTKALKVSIK